MTEAAGIFALFSALLLIVAVAIWGGFLRGPLMQRLGGRRESNAAPAELGSQALVLALGMSAVAAALALAGWIAP